jgi:E3 ubiquitin-protein ligase MARCH6
VLRQLGLTLLVHNIDPDDAEVCRVCRTEAEPDNPLYHPCKCSGSIRYVHSEW